MGEQPSPSSTEYFADVDVHFSTLTTLELAQRMNEADATVARAVRAALPSIAEAADAIAAALGNGGRLVHVGSGTSVRLAEVDASECPPTFSTAPEQIVVIRSTSEDDLAEAVSSLDGIGLTSSDIVVGTAASGRTPFVIAALEHARDSGCVTVGISCNTGSAVGAAAQIPIEVDTGPEFIAGSTRLKAGTAQKMILNMLSTLAMVRLGRTYRNLMVAMSARNSKLNHRAVRIVAAAAAVDEARAAAALDAADDDIRVAAVIAGLGVDPTVARHRLDDVDGHLEKVL